MSSRTPAAASTRHNDGRLIFYGSGVLTPTETAIHIIVNVSFGITYDTTAAHDIFIQKEYFDSCLRPCTPPLVSMCGKEETLVIV